MRKILCALLGMLLAGTSWSATLPAGYTELEYIESSGTQYIDTGYIPTTDLSKIEFKFNVSTDNTTIFGVSNSSTSRVQVWHYQDRYSSRTFTNTTNNISSVVLSLNIDITGNLDVTNGKLTINGNSGISTDIDYKTNYSYPMYVFALNNASATPTTIASGKVYYLKVYENGTLVQDLVPAKNSSNVIGMYDTVSGTFFTNAGTGTFVGGPAVLDSCRNLFNVSTLQVGYIKADGTFDTDSTYRHSGFIPVTGGTTYTESGTNGLYGGRNKTLSWYAEDYSYISSTGKYVGSVGDAWTLTATAPANAKYVVVCCAALDTNIQVELGSTATEYVPYCANAIKIATTAYNSARFSPVVTELNDTIATIRSVVTNTINQTKAIADLQATKQTRPNENCPAGKKCLLVEDNDGTPHWYEIIENAD